MPHLDINCTTKYKATWYKHAEVPTLPTVEKFLKSLTEQQRSFEGLTEIYKQVNNACSQMTYGLSLDDAAKLQYIHPKMSAEAIQARYYFYKYESARKRAERLVKLVYDALETTPERLEIRAREGWRAGRLKYMQDKKEIALFNAIINKNDLLSKLSAFELYRSGDVVVEREYANEYISISVHASVWTYYVDGYMKIDGVEYRADKVSYNSEANRL